MLILFLVITVKAINTVVRLTLIAITVFAILVWFEVIKL